MMPAVESGSEALVQRDAWLAHCAKAARSFDYFATFMCGFRIHDGQRDVVKTMEDEDHGLFGVLAASNGWGKTLLDTLILLWGGFGKHYAPAGWGQWRGVVLGPTLQQALITHGEIELIRKNAHEAQKWCDHPAPCEMGFSCPEAKVHQFRLGRWLQSFRTDNDHAAFRWTHNGAIMNFESGVKKWAAIEGWRINLLIYDEARLELHLKHGIENVALARGVRAPGMRIMLISTPLATSAELLMYFEKGQKRIGGWWSRQGDIKENIFLNAEQVAKIEANLDPRVRDQVMRGKWVEPPDAFFITDYVEACFDKSDPIVLLDQWQGLLRQGSLYAGGLDAATSPGAEADWTVFTIWDLAWPGKPGPFRMIYERIFPKGTSLTKAVQYIDPIVAYFNAIVGFDANGPFGIELGHNVSFNQFNYVPITWTTGGKNRPKENTFAKVQVLTNFSFLMNNAYISFPNLPELKAQIVAYKLEDQHLTTDRLMAQVLAGWIAKDYLSFATSGAQLPQWRESGNPYAGQGVTFGPDIRPEWADKTDLQRKLLAAVEMQKSIDERRKRRD